MKNTMKLFWLLAAASVVLSCSKEAGQNLETTPEEEKTPAVIIPATDGNLLTSFGVTFEGDVQDEETKVSVNLGTGVTAMEENDEVLVFVDGENNAIYKYDGEKFVLKEGETAVALGAPASVYYPASEFAKTTADFTMPAAIEASGDFGAINPMAGVISGEPGSYSVTLGNIASVLRVQVSAGVNINSISLDFGSGVTYAAGSTFSVDASTKAMTAKTASAETTETVALGTPGTAADVLFILPTLELSNGLTVTANLADNHNGGANSFSISKATYTPAANKISSMSFYAGLFSGGAGTSVSPYLISNARDFKNIQKYTTEGYTPGSMTAASFLGAYYQQTADIDFKNASLTPIGTGTAAFTGSYDGNDKSLDKFTISTDDYAGIFGFISGGTVENLSIGSLVSITVTAEDKAVGGIVGKITAGNIARCVNDASVRCSASGGNSYAGGIVGAIINTTSNVSISECINNGSIYGNIFVGGIAGAVNGGSYEAVLFKCINNADVTAKTCNAGGITGALYKGTINVCYGGKATTSNNYPTGGAYVKAVSRAGGLVGIMNNENAWVLNSSSRAFVWTTGNNSESYKAAAGGLVGYINAGGHIVNCVHWNMNVTNTGASSADDAKGKIAVGGIVGYVKNNGQVANCYTQRQGNALGCYTLSSESQMTGLCLANNSKGTWIGQIYGYNAGAAVNCYYSAAYSGLGTNAGTDRIVGVANDVKNGTADVSNVQLYDLSGTASGSPITGRLWEILEAGKTLTGWTGSDDMSWTHYTNGSLEVAIPTVILNAGSDYYL